MKVEWDRLFQKKVWDMDSVKEWDDVAGKAEACASGLDPQVRPDRAIGKKSAATRQIMLHPRKSSGKQAQAVLYAL
jgi:hypothetical protein